MSDPDSLVGAYFDARNTHDGAAVAGLFAHGGTHEDPTTDGPVPASTVSQVVESLTAAFPDLAFERRSTMGAGASRVVEWVMRGHNRGSLGPGMNPTGIAVELRGVDVFDFENNLVLPMVVARVIHEDDDHKRGTGGQGPAGHRGRRRQAQCSRTTLVVGRVGGPEPAGTPRPPLPRVVVREGVRAAASPAPTD